MKNNAYVTIPFLLKKLGEAEFRTTTFNNSGTLISTNIVTDAYGDMYILYTIANN